MENARTVLGDENFWCMSTTRNADSWTLVTFFSNSVPLTVHYVELDTTNWKACTKCKVMKPFSQYNISNANKKDGLNYHCKPCVQIGIKESKARKANGTARKRSSPVQVVQLPCGQQGKVCTQCQVVKRLEDFIKGTSAGNRRNICKVCYAINLAAGTAKGALIPADTMKECNKCNIWQLISEFPARGINKDGKRSYCKSCATEKYAGNKEAWENAMKNGDITVPPTTYCPRCERHLPTVENYHFNGTAGFRRGCNKCVNLMSGYGITYKQFVEMIAMQNGECLYCKYNLQHVNSKNVHVDHLHDDREEYRFAVAHNGKEAFLKLAEKLSVVPSTKVGMIIRGVSCVNCNLGYGLLKESPTTMRGIVQYLTNFEDGGDVFKTTDFRTFKAPRIKSIGNPTLNEDYNQHLTTSQLVKMLQFQGCKCPICGMSFLKPGTTNTLDLSLMNVDHCHQTGGIRGLPCASCNKGMGQLGGPENKDTMAMFPAIEQAIQITYKWWTGISLPDDYVLQREGKSILAEYQAYKNGKMN